MDFYMLDVVSENGTRFRVLAIPASVAGPNAKRAPAGRADATVEFYDRAHNHEPEIGGQFVSDYNVRTLLGRPGGYGRRIGEGGAGLDLAGGVPQWSVDADACGLIATWVEGLDASGALD